MHTLYGIRHHGPGSAKSIAAAFAASPPDALVIEAPEELSPLLNWLLDAELQPPVAALFWAADDAKRANFYPFAVFSPEWVALHWARRNGLAVYCMDLPMRHVLAPPPEAAAQPAQDAASAALPNTSADVADAAAAASPSAPQHALDEDAEDEGEDDDADCEGDEPSAEDERKAAFRRDPIAALADAAGYTDSEAWWEHLVEAQGHDAFAAITEAMQAVRAAGLGNQDTETLQREAHMRQTLRTAIKAGHQNIAVVCGAWHAPELTAAALKAHSIKDDSALLKALPKTKVEATWVPWSSSRLAQASGYGAGVEAPGWYAHLFAAEDASQIATTWLAKTAQALRAEDLDAPSASVIEAVRLAETLATLRRRRSPDLSELREAALATFCHGEVLTLKLAEERLLGLSPRFDQLGRVPEALPASPLQQDFAARNKALRLKTEALEKRVELDLRQEHDRGKSQHFWRLQLLGLDWAENTEASRSRGSYKEAWELRWQPEHALDLIAAGTLGATIEQAAAAAVLAKLDQAAQLPRLLDLADVVLKAALSAPLPPLLAAIDSRAAVATDIHELLAALPPLMGLIRYGDVRGTAQSSMGALFGGLLSRTCIALPAACAQLNPDAAAELLPHLNAVHDGLQVLADEDKSKEWRSVLCALGDATTTASLIAGRAVRLLVDDDSLDAEAAARKLGLALAASNPPLEAAAWLEGFVSGSVHLLLNQPELRGLITDWLRDLRSDHFTELLPLVRRAFSAYSVAERRLLLQEVLSNSTPATRAAEATDYPPEALQAIRQGLLHWIGVSP